MPHPHATESPVGSRVAVLDVGSNSIKLLIAAPGPEGGIAAVASRATDARISAGISKEHPQLCETGMRVGLEAIRWLLAEAAQIGYGRLIMVATSAVRSAENGEEFCRRVERSTGQQLRIISGTQEAALIGRGLLLDPSLVALKDFYVFDLGGGSLECLAFRSKKRVQGISLPLGCVRLTERFVTNPAAPIPPDDLKAIGQHTFDALSQSGFLFDLPVHAEAIFAGGSMTTARSIRAAAHGYPLGATSPYVPLGDLKIILANLASLSLSERRVETPGLPPARADVMPTALVTMITLAEYAGFRGYHHSFYNLRYGLADELLRPTGLLEVDKKEMACRT